MGQKLWVPSKKHGLMKKQGLICQIMRYYTKEKGGLISLSLSLSLSQPKQEKKDIFSIYQLIFIPIHITHIHRLPPLQPPSYITLLSLFHMEKKGVGVGVGV